MGFNNCWCGGQKHNDPVMWTSWLNKTTWLSLYKGRSTWTTSPSSYLSQVDWVLLPRHFTMCLMAYCTFYGKLWPGVFGVIYSAAWLPCQQSGIHYSVGLSPHSLQRGGNSSTRNSPAQCRLPSVGEIIVVSAIPQGWDTNCGWSSMKELVAVKEPLTTGYTCK